jgi:hypothetical protein
MIFDEANLLRIDTLQELHTLLIFEQNSLNNLTMVLCGQSQLRDLLSNMQMAIDEVFEEDYLPMKIRSKLIGKCQQDFHEAAGDLMLERRMPPDLNEIF